MCVPREHAKITNSFSVRDVEMDSWSCPVGWPIQGLAAGPAGVAKGAGHHGAGAVMACRSHRGDVMVVRDEGAPEGQQQSSARTPSPPIPVIGESAFGISISCTHDVSRFLIVIPPFDVKEGDVSTNDCVFFP